MKFTAFDSAVHLLSGVIHKKSPLVIKVTLLVLGLALLTSAKSYGQITLHEKNAPLAKVLNDIKKQTKYVFLYDERQLNIGPITADITNASIESTLKEIFKGCLVEYNIVDNHVLIKPKKQLPKASQGIGANGQISGSLIDTLGNPIPGATIKLEPGSEGTVSAKDGRFNLPNLPMGEYTMTIAFVGYQHINKLVELTDENPLVFYKLIMRETPSVLNEVTISTGYQHIKLEQSTGSVDYIGTKKYESSINTDFLSGLQGRMPGVLINNDIKFNNNNLFQIRGLSTISGNSAPLIVLDGYPTDLSLSDVNPNEIKSVTILKDAAAAAIYGVKASNGVVVIESKTGVEGAPKIAFRTTVTFTPKEDYSNYRWAPSDTYLNYERYIYQDGSASSISPAAASYYLANNALLGPGLDLIYEKAAGEITEAQLQQQMASLGSYNNASDYSRLFNRIASTQTYNLDVSGGSKSALYYITGNFANGTANQVNNSNQQFQLTARSDFNFSSKLSLELIDDYNQHSTRATPIPDINSLYPYDHFQDEYGNALPIYESALGGTLLNTLLSEGLKDPQVYPLIDMNAITNNTTVADNRFTAHLKYLIGHGFDLSFGGDYERSQTLVNNYDSDQSSVANQIVDYYARLGANGAITYNIPPGGYQQQNNTELMSYTMRAQLDYSGHFGSDHSFNGIIGSEIQRETTSTSNAALFGYDNQTLQETPVNYAFVNSNAATTGVLEPLGGLNVNTLFGQTYTDDRYVSFYSNGAYSYKSRYTITGSARIDQSNLFGTDPKYRYKPMWSVGSAWDITKEDFMKNVSWVKALKLRLADGITGNVAKDAIPQVIAQSGINLATTPTSTSAYNLYAPADGGLRWESTNNFNAGLDFQIFKGISGSLDYYDKKTTDVLGNNAIDPTHGVSSAIINQSSIDNKGLEIQLNADWITTKDVNWFSGFVLSHNTSKVLSVYNGGQNSPIFSYQWVQNPINYVAGYPVGAFFSYKFAGLDNTGAPLIYNKSGKKISPTTTGLAANEVVYSGTQIPAYTVGMSNRVDIGKFYIYCMINYYGGFDVRVPAPNPDAARPVAGSQNFWKQPGDENSTDVMNPNLTNYSAATLDAYNDANIFVVSGDYVTLSNLTASYNFGALKSLKKLGFTNFQLLLQGSNLYTRGFNKYDFSQATGSFVKNYVTPTYTIGLYTNF
jgi:TonB-linked SusC/RagA family outer membrane protein